MRKPRVLRDGAIYHVSARTNGKDLLMAGIPARDLFVRVLDRARERFDFRLENFCVMGNHFHLLVRPGPGTSLSRLMQWVMSVFAMALNRARGRTGHVWGERFFSRIVESFRGLCEVFGYIDGNPERAGLTADRRGWRHGGLSRHRSGTDCRDRPGAWTFLVFPEHRVLSLPVPS